jgi:outer membrane protein
MMAEGSFSGRRGKLLAVGLLMYTGCAAQQPFESAPPSPDRAWKAPDLRRYEAALSESEHTRAHEAPAVSIDSQKAYELSELIDIAERTNPETRVAWERARQAAIGVGLAEGTYYPVLATAATGAVAHVPIPIPTTVVPGGIFIADTHFVIPVLSLEWLLLDFGRRRAQVDAAQAQAMEANVSFNAKHQQIVFDVTRKFYSLTAVRGEVAAARAPSIPRAASKRRQRCASSTSLPRFPRSCRHKRRPLGRPTSSKTHWPPSTMLAWRCSKASASDPVAPIEVADVSQQPLPPTLEESVDQVIDRALMQRRDLIARLAAVRAKEAEVRKARADYWPRLSIRSALAGNIGELKVENSPYQGVADLQYDAGFRLEWTLFEGFERRNKVHLAESQQKEAEDELEHAKDAAVREVWKAYNDTKVALAKQQAAAALLAASEKAWDATLESYKHGLATFPDVRESQRDLAHARKLGQAARAEVWTRAAAFAFSTGDLARP